MVVVAVVAHAIVPGLPWAAAFVLGAVVSPTDPVAATAIMQRLGVPRRVVTIVEGESLINDGTALVAYRFAVVGSGQRRRSRSGRPGSRFVLERRRRRRRSGSRSAGSSARCGAGSTFCRRRSTISLLTGYFAYIPAELMGVSAVIAAVTAGIYLGWHTPELTTPEVRLMGESTWEIVTFASTRSSSRLIGLQLPGILDELDAYSTRRC